jgi:excisionase family DNA binding protein
VEFRRDEVNNTEIEQEDPFMTVVEIAAMLRVSKMTVYRLLNDGHITCTRIGRAYRSRESEVHKYLSRVTQQANR